MPRLFAGLSIALFLTGCATVRDDSVATASPGPLSVATAMHELQHTGAPARFAKVHDRLYRGGQPSAEHLRLLHSLGVTKVVDLRRERLDLRRAERATARELGIEFVELPFFGVFGADPEFLTRAIQELHTDDGGAVYVHCDNGRDRTALVVALYRVVVDGWSLERAWQREVLAYGHAAKPVYREIRLTFQDYALEHGARFGTRASAPARGRALAQLSEDRPDANDANAADDASDTELVDAGGATPTGAVVEPRGGDPAAALQDLWSGGLPAAD